MLVGTHPTERGWGKTIKTRVSLLALAVAVAGLATPAFAAGQHIVTTGAASGEGSLRTALAAAAEKGGPVHWRLRTWRLAHIDAWLDGGALRRINAGVGRDACYAAQDFGLGVLFMAIFEDLSSAMHADDVDAYMALHHPDFRYDRQKSGDSIGYDEMAAVLRKVWAPGNRRIEDLRCIYENDDLLLVRLRLAFKSGSRESALIAYLKEGGKIIRTESGVSELSDG